MLLWVTENTVAGHMWPTGHLPTPDLNQTQKH